VRIRVAIPCPQPVYGVRNPKPTLRQHLARTLLPALQPRLPRAFSARTHSRSSFHLAFEIHLPPSWTSVPMGGQVNLFIRRMYRGRAQAQRCPVCNGPRNRQRCERSCEQELRRLVTVSNCTVGSFLQLPTVVRFRVSVTSFSTKDVRTLSLFQLFALGVTNARAPRRDHLPAQHMTASACSTFSNQKSFFGISGAIRPGNIIGMAATMLLHSRLSWSTGSD